MIDLIHFTIIIPLVGFLINGLLGRKIKNEKVIGAIGSGAVGIAFIIALGALFQLLSLPESE
ncbi:MAG: hypothetical protein K9I69_08515, partial [Ignavibacteriales bacterium]|nr:hypothetical protein [Ignavibacteriales bacterium]